FSDSLWLVSGRLIRCFDRKWCHNTVNFLGQTHDIYVTPVCQTLTTDSPAGQGLLKQQQDVHDEQHQMWQSMHNRYLWCRKVTDGYYHGGSQEHHIATAFS